MANAEMNKALEKSAVKIKKTILALKKAAKKAGMEKTYGPNGPMGELAIDLVFPNMSPEVFSELLNTDEKAMKLREVYRFTLGKQGIDMLATARMDSLDRYLGATDCADTFERFANAFDDVKGKSKTVEKMLTLAQDKELLKSTVSKADSEEKVKGARKDIATEIDASPLNDNTAAIADTLERVGGGKSLEDFVKNNKPKNKGEK